MTDKERFDLIDRYFKNELSESELKEFNEHYASDDQFAEEVANHEMVNEVIIDAGLIDIKNKLNQIQKEHTTSKAKNGHFGKGSIIGASMSIIALLIGIWFFQNNNDVAQKNPNKAKEPKQALVEDKENLGGNASKKDNQNKQESDKTDNTKQRKSDKKSNTSNRAQDQDNNKGDKKQELTKVKRDNSSNVDNLLKGNNNLSGPKQVKDLSFDSINVESKNQDDKTNKINDCQNTDISLNYRVVKSCRDKANGAIILDTNSFNGGIKPYQFALSKGENYQQKTAFNELNRGYYTLYVKDANGCEGKVTNLYIPSKDCQKKSYTFVPKEEEAWEFPFENHANGKVKIFNKQGKMVYQSSVRNGTPSNWRGRDNEGQRLPMGLYYVVFNKDGGVDVNWNLTIMR